MNWIEILKVLVQGLVEGFTEWLPISSTGHMILVDAMIPMEQPEQYMEVFRVVIQLGAILAVVTNFFHSLWPFRRTEQGSIQLQPSRIQLWVKIIVACLPAAVLGLLLDDLLEKYLYNPVVVALMLLIYGGLFIWIERRNEHTDFSVNSLRGLDLRTALLIGCFQCLALIPGTSRSGATILGAMLLGVNRTAAAEFSFYLSIPVMFGASLLKLLKSGFVMSGSQLFYLIFAMLIAYLVSMYSIRFLMDYIKRHSFSIFGWYRIGLGVLVLLYFGVARLMG